MLVVIDTNIFVSAFLSPNGKPAFIAERLFRGVYTACYDDRIMQEYESVLLRPKFGFPPEIIRRLLLFIRRYGINVKPSGCDVPFVDESDKKFYEVAKHCNAVLITGNKKHFPQDELVKGVHEI